MAGISGPSLLIESTDSMIRVCTATQKTSVGMYSGCDTLSLQTLFVYFLALAAIHTSSFNFIQLFFILVII